MLPRRRYLGIIATDILRLFRAVERLLSLTTTIIVLSEPHRLPFLRHWLAWQTIELILLLIATVLRLISMELLRHYRVQVHVGTRVIGERHRLESMLADRIVVTGEGSELLIFASVPLCFPFLVCDCEHFLKIGEK